MSTKPNHPYTLLHLPRVLCQPTVESTLNPGLKVSGSCTQAAEYETIPWFSAQQTLCEKHFGALPEQDKVAFYKIRFDNGDPWHHVKDTDSDWEFV